MLKATQGWSRNLSWIIDWLTSYLLSADSKSGALLGAGDISGKNQRPGLMEMRFQAGRQTVNTFIYNMIQHL